MKPFLRRRSGVLQRPSFLGGLYLSLIPLFAIIYTWGCPSDFAHTNLLLEESRKRDLAETSQRVLDEALPHVREIVGRDGLVGVIDYEDKIFSVDFLMLMPRNTISGKCRLYSAMAQIRIGIAQVEDYLIDCDTFFRSGNGTDAEPTWEDVVRGSSLYDPNNSGRTSISGHSVRTYSIPSLKRLERLHSGVIQEANWDTFTRMLYFSAVSMTTLGFGDIVPITRRARWLVICETLAGVILIGLFLNAIASRRQTSDRSSKQPLVEPADD